MKKIFTHLFAVLLLSLVTVSNVWAETITLVPSGGTYDGTGNYCKTWTSNSEPVVTLSVAVNNMTVGAVGGGFGIARGQNADSNWTFSVAGYKILSYSFNYKLQDGSTAADIVITVNNEAHTVTTTSQLLEVNDVNASAASFTLSGTNETIILTNVTIEAEPLLEDGAVYRFVNVGDVTRALSTTALTDVGTAVSGNNDRSQQWLATKTSAGVYTFRNLSNGRYLQGNNTTSGGWSLTKDSNEFTVTLVNGNYCFRGASHTSGYAYMHRNGSNDIVSWEKSSTSTQWTKERVEYTEEQLKTVWEEVEALVVPSTTVDTYEGYLDVLFSDKSCVTPKLATLDAAKATEAYKNLPAALQKMVDKVYGGNWAESTVAPADRPNGNNNTNHDLWTVADTWDNDYAKKFRVQMYEPYSVEGEITSYLRINAHCNMDNPTGIYANAGEPIYIMVEGTIAEGAELWVAHQVGHGATNYYNNAAYTQLQEGLNVVPYFADGSQLWINYLVHTYNADGTTIAEKFPEDRQLSKYKPLKIHIEGGKINGFFNAMGDYRATTDAENLWGDVDNDADWNYYKARAALSGDFALLGHRQTLLFDFGTYNSTKGHFGVANADGGIEYALAYHLENITVPATPNCYGGIRGTFGTFAGSYPNMNLDALNGKINIMLEAWDRIQYSEHASLGLLSVANINKMNALYPRWTTAGEAAEIYNYGEATINNVTQTYQQFCQGIDYSEYYNHHGAAVGSGSGYMSGGWRVCNYHYNTMGSIIGKIAVEPGPTWGPAHEIGHQHQTIFNLNGQTEVTNNFHSNVAVWYMGMGTSRYNGSEGSLSSVLGAFNTDGNDLYTNNIWALTHLYYRLWLYYHLAGNNTQFWPRLFELLRQVPIVNGGQISGETSLLRFYQHACDAAGEDLTEFFRAHGFFELMTDRLVGDYSNGTYNVTEEQIETAISTIKAKNYPVNYAVLLINDGTSETTLKHDGATHRSLWDSNPSAELGSVNDFIDGDTVATADYAAVVSADGTVTMTGTGGVGFLILNEKGELVSFSNKKTFAISDEAAYLLATGKATISAVNTESVISEVEVDLSAIQREMLLALINKVEAMPIDDGSYTHVGFYTKASAGDLLAALESAKAAYESGSGYGAAYEMLYTEKEKFVNSSNHSFVPFDPSLTYIITNCAYRGKTMHLNSGLKSATGVDQTANTARWKFVQTDSVGVYYVQNVGGNYLTAPAKSATVGSTVTVGDAATFTLLQESPVGAWSISLSPAAEYTTLHDNSHGNVVGWSAGVDPSKWYLTAVEGSTNSQATQASDELQALITKTEALVDVVGMAIPCALQTTDNSVPFYLYCNANVTSGGDKSLPADGYNILDRNDQTFLHTVYSGNSVDGLNHYLLLDLGEGNTLSTIQFYYKTRHNGDSNSHPQVIKVEGSNDKETFVEIETISSGLPNVYSTEYTSSELTNGNEYRYFRFMVTDTYGTATDDNGHEYFYIAEFGIPSLPGVYTKVDAEYQAYVTDTDMQTIYNAIVEAKAALESGTDLSTAKKNLQTAYDTFYALYKKPIDEKKTELETLADATDEVIASVGTIETSKITQLALTTDNLYCNAPYTAQNNSDYSAEYVSKLTDTSVTTFLHTDYSGSIATPHYLRVYLGENSTAKRFKFNYTTRDNGNNCPTTIEIEGCNEENGTYSPIKTLTTADGLPNPDQNTNGGVAEAFESEIITMSTAYKYVRFKVTGVEGGGATFFVISTFGFSTVEDVITIDTAYDGIVSEDLWLSTYNTSGDSHLMAAETSNPTLAQLEAQITKLTAAKATLEAAMNQVNKSGLETSLAAINALYSKMADGEGNIASDYTPSALTPQQLTAIKAVIDNAQAVFDYAGATQLEVNNAKTAVDEKYTELLTIENANVNLSGTFDKSELGTLITNAAALLSTINGKTENNNDYYAAAGIAIDELQEAYNAAVAAKDRYYLTQEQYAAVKEALNNSYTTINPIVAADVAGRDELTTLIANVNTLLGTIAEESAPKNVAVPLQSTAADGNFYIWCNSPAGDSDGVAGLIDKNADGTANTGTFLGTSWGSTVAAYTHYIEVDLGEGITIDKLLFDYTTRNSTHSNQRPTAIKILGSNDKTDYTEITIISEGLATEQCQQWSMAETLELGAPYRYIRFAVATQESTGFFNMSDFNLYALIGHTRALKEYYTTAEGLELDALCIALQSAEYAEDHYLTNEQLSAVKNMLNGYYTAANTIVEADVEAGDRTDLTGLVAETETLIDEVATVTVLDTPELSETNVYCNADNSTNTDAGDSDKLGVAALLDGDVSTHLHTTYGGKEQDDNEDHYIRVDMGENSEITAFRFSYTGRQANSNNAPTDMLVQACNTTDGEWVTLKTLTGLPTGTAPVSYESELIEMSDAYRYVRFMVTDTYNHDTTTPSGGTAHKFFVMSEFGFTAYPTVEVDENYPRVTTALVRAAYDEKNTATAENDYYMTESDYNAALAALQADYDALDAAATADKSELEALIEATTILKDQLYETVITSYTANEVTLSITEGDAGYIYCNAPEKNSTWTDDNAGVVALIDLTDGNPNLETFLHTEYGNDQSADGLDHYLRVDLGADGATDYVEFGYYGRSGHLAKSPKKVIVAATNDLTDGGEWTTIATLNLAQASASTETKTGCLGNGVKYRYWRFLVEETHAGSKDGNNHQFFCMTQFNVYKCTDVVISSQLKYTPNIYIYTTSELVTEVENAISAATIVKDDAEALQPAVNAAVEALQAVYDKLAEALKYADAPVEITTDEANPILYNIISKRADDGSKVLQFDEPTSDKVAIVDKADNASYQAWYFMQGENGYLIKPFNGMGKKLGVESTGDAQASVSIAEDPEYSEWNFARSTVDGCTDYYYIYVDGTGYACLSHNGGFDVTDKLGIWASGWNSNDGGSLFKFIGAEFENDNAHFYQLSDFENTLEYRTADTPEGEMVGAFVNGSAYSEAYTAASTLITAGNTSDATACRDAYTALRIASDNLEENVIEEGKYYRIDITPGLTDGRAGASMCIDDNGKLAWGEFNAADARFYFTFEYDSDDNLYMKNLHTATYLDEALGNSTDKQVGADAETITDAGSNVVAKSVDINTLGTSGDAVVVGITPNGGAMLNCKLEEKIIVAYDNTAVDKASAWVITEVADITPIKHNVTMNAVFSSVTLGYNATVPAGVEAYNAEGLKDGYVTLVKVAGEGEVIPENTPVILYRTDDEKTKTFSYTNATASKPSESLLGGSLYTKYVKCDDGDYYKLMIKSGEAKMYLMYKEFNAEGVSQGATHDGGHIKCSANKIYMRVPAALGVASYGMRFVDYGTTDIDDAKGENQDAETIYDLQGRKLSEITEPGFYIVDGKRVYVK